MAFIAKTRNVYENPLKMEMKTWRKIAENK